MDKFLVITKSYNNKNSIVSFLKKSGYNDISSAGSGSETRRLLLKKDYSVCIIDAPLSDEFGLELALFIVQNHNCSSILLVKSDIEEEITAKAEDYGVIVVSKPINIHYFHKMIKISITSNRRIFNINSENKKLQDKIDELKLIDRAKCILIEKQKITESDAHRYIEKKAMDSRSTRKKIAVDIIEQYKD